MDAKQYKDTLNLPQTTFPMKANLREREPEQVKAWDAINLYEKILEKNRDRPKYILHDGPPYANGNIHFGHILNKVLKDIIVKYKNMSGYASEFIPGWDCHGLPIEHHVTKKLGPKKNEMSILEIRQACRDYANQYIDIQRDEFKRLGILGRWKKPYLTMDYNYESIIAKEFGKLVAAGGIYRGKKPVLWCAHCQTALAEAEVEYDDHSSPSIYVKFQIDPKDLNFLNKGIDQPASIVIWTTTPWTLPANLGVALHPSYDYVALKTPSEIFIVAKNLVDNFVKAVGIKDHEIIERFSGQNLERKECQHPFYNRKSLIVLSEHVTLDTGTGCVHIAPGHGQEDYEVGLKYGLDIFVPVDHRGCFTQEVQIESLKNRKVEETNKDIIKLLKEKKALLKDEILSHSYPHCWRCKNPVIFRATEQWFISLEKNDLRHKALDSIRRVDWIPPWGRDRIYGMVQNRLDWCISRQRSWGVPIVALTCQKCHLTFLDQKLIGKMADAFAQKGADIWFDEKAMPPFLKQVQCPDCGAQDFHRETDILDVWFDSGVSYAAVLEQEKTLSYPADLYLEGSDQHRGWFHSSLLTAIGTRNTAPYKTVLTHGFVVDGEGKKYSKSVKNYTPPDKLIQTHGAEILRLWVAAEDYRNDIRFSDEIITRLVEAYRKIRNTCRFLLGNIGDYSPVHSPLDYENLLEIDKWALHQLQKLMIRLNKAYEDFAFHVVFHELNKFCTVTLSAFYLDILKDRLYTSKKNGAERLSAQKVLFEITKTLSPLMAPILSFTAEEIWTHMGDFPGKVPSVHLASLPEPKTEWIDETLATRWQTFQNIRDKILTALEKARKDKMIGNSLEAAVFIGAGKETQALLEQYRDILPQLFIVSQVNLIKETMKSFSHESESENLLIEVKKALGKKCERCWNYAMTVGDDPQHPLICHRCVQTLSS
ncbi:MAG: isoleucine--tRNA ligase [Deltaproteobacteria bacterium RIFCSPLOWO2_02_FULL_50_16]|nr:MAG: isoleucine--tRNA ligase [Deltaproteobacteria bacterium GWA2_50_8]OGQ31024.1 MAG: isoleucine--tRNA ligase [Deltaproteobacteria bacterium RIFCSPHIGHO2_02_FULL_50_15]OGQ55516.1 MAG: isoleucine--tRNA ligase [Deltaproteobacteria bacterium RIFCSPLOWO2_02_FULL_50_16]